MTGQAVTTNPVLIMAINMTIVFGVLFLLGYVINLIHLLDPTRKKAVQVEESAAVAPAAQAAVVEEPTASMEEKELAAVVTTAIMAYGYKNVKIKSIKKV